MKKISLLIIAFVAVMGIVLTPVAFAVELQPENQAQLLGDSEKSSDKKADHASDDAVSSDDAASSDHAAEGDHAEESGDDHKGSDKKHEDKGKHSDQKKESHSGHGKSSGSK